MDRALGSVSYMVMLVVQFYSFEKMSNNRVRAKNAVSPGNVLFTLNRTTHISVLLLCVVRFTVNKTLSNAKAIKSTF